MRHRCLLALLILSTAHVTQAAKPKTSVKARTGAPSHPLVPGFERFDPSSKDAEPKADTVDRGRLLLGELNCTACHEADASTRTALVPKQAPVLSDVGARVKPEWLRELLNNPRHAKPGTTMPNVLARLKPEERTRQVEALVHFLVSTGDKPPADQAPNKQSAERGEKLFHQAGCVACHAPRKDDAPALSTSVPLGDPGAKYSIPTLAKFLRDPLAVRPSGRMPNLNLTIDEGYDLAHYFLRDVAGTPPNLNYEYFEGDFRMVDFGQKGSKTSGTCLGFDLGLARKSEQFAFRFTGFLRIANKGTYTLYATSDDGSRVEVDGETVVNHDGLHAASTKSGEVTLDAGMHELTVVYFNNEKDSTLEVEIEGPDLPRGDVTRLVSLTEEAAPPEMKAAFQVDEQLAAEGRKVFASAGCASCHELREPKETKAIASSLKAPKFSALDVNKGCLAEAPKGHAPNFGLNVEQREALRQAARAKPRAKKGAEERDDTIVQSMAAFNCVACHARDGWGGVESARNGYFVTTIPEMGDEGRVPPPLTGVGGKLTMSWMRSTVDKGAKARPYMLTRMPAFGIRNAKPIIEAFEAADLLPPKPLPEFDEPMYRIKDQGRFLVGSKAFSCIKCHTFDKYKAEGIQSIDMTTMTKRLRPEWFVRYVRDPMTFRPGTRMPAAWPKEGKSYLPTVFDGDSEKQIAAVWTYLEGGNKATPPAGVGGDPIELVATTEPIVYRNFIEGAGARAIAVAYPAKVNLAFDAADFRLATIWKGAFLDAAPHWSSRGQGFQPPLGDHVIPLCEGVAFAQLESPESPWPTEHGRERGDQLLGYRLDKARQPTLMYRIGDVRVDDFPEPVTGGTTAQLQRTLSLTVASEKMGESDRKARSPKNFWFRAAVAPRIEASDGGWYTVDRVWKMRLDGAGTPVIRSVGKEKELLVPVVFKGGNAQIVQTFDW